MEQNYLGKGKDIEFGSSSFKKKQNALYKLSYNVDIIFCIDSTESMKPVLDMVKSNAMNFYSDFTRTMERKKKNVSQVRIKVIAYRDFYYDWQDGVEISDFFQMPEQIMDFRNFIRKVDHKGGGDIPEDGLEALALAMKSDWCKDGSKRRHVIVVWSDAGTHKLGFGKIVPFYPKNMPKNFNELTQMWGTKAYPGIMDQSAKRLIMFTPNEDSWTSIRDNWNYVIHYESKAGQGLKECDYNQILNVICNSI